MTETRDPRRLCADVSVSAGDDPGGSGTPFNRYLGVEVPPPWKEDVSASRNFPEGLMQPVAEALAKGVIGKFTGLLPEPDYSVEGHTRVLLMSRPAAPLAAFERGEYILPDEKLLPFARALAEGAEALAPFEDYREDGDGVRDILVCTHGANDVCCGKYGYPLYDRLRERAGESGGTLRVRRTSHIGGHRFAATLMDFPEGRYWGHLDPETAERALFREGDAADLEKNCRGWAALDNPFEQIAERAMLAREGWAWTTYLKSSTLLQSGEDGARVRIEYASPDGSASGAYEAEIEANGSVMTLPKSGPNPLQEVPQYRVARLEKAL